MVLSKIRRAIGHVDLGPSGQFLESCSRMIDVVSPEGGSQLFPVSSMRYLPPLGRT